MTIPVQQAGDIPWTFADDAPAPARNLLASGDWVRHAAIIKANRRRTIYHIASTPPLIVKHDSPPRLLDRIKAHWRKAGVREYDAVVAMREAGLPVPRPIGCATHGLQSFCAMTELQDCEKLRVAWKRAQTIPERRAALLEAISRFAATFALAGVIHPDMHTGNILVRRKGCVHTCYLVDLAGAMCARETTALTPWQTVGWLTHLSPSLGAREACEILEAAIVPLARPALDIWISLLRRKAHEDAKRWPGRKRRLLQSSSLCRQHDTPGGTWRLMKPFPPETAEALLQEHRRNVDRGNLLKNDRKRRLSRVIRDNTSYVIKEFREPGLGPWRADRQSWFCHYRMTPDDLPVCRCHGWLQTRHGGWLVLEDVGAETLRTFASRTSAQRRRRALTTAGRLVAWLHTRGIWHRDMKATNLVIHDENAPVPIRLVDCDRVCFDRDITPAQRARNLHQLIGNLPQTVTTREKLRLAAEYRREAGITKDDLRTLLTTLPGRNPAEPY